MEEIRIRTEDGVSTLVALFSQPEESSQSLP